MISRDFFCRTTFLLFLHSLALFFFFYIRKADSKILLFLTFFRNSHFFYLSVSVSFSQLHENFQILRRLPMRYKYTGEHRTSTAFSKLNRFHFCKTCYFFSLITTFSKNGRSKKFSAKFKHGREKSRVKILLDETLTLRNRQELLLPHNAGRLAGLLLKCFINRRLFTQKYLG